MSYFVTDCQYIDRAQYKQKMIILTPLLMNSKNQSVALPGAAKTQINSTSLFLVLYHGNLVIHDNKKAENKASFLPDPDSDSDSDSDSE